MIHMKFDHWMWISLGAFFSNSKLGYDATHRIDLEETPEIWGIATAQKELVTSSPALAYPGIQSDIWRWDYEI